MSGNLFFAIDIESAATRLGLLQLIESLKPRVPRATWTTEDKLHITLEFLGPITETWPLASLESLSERPGTISISGGECFMNRGGPRVMYAKIADNGLCYRLRSSLGFKSDRFTPHLTLAKLESKNDFEPTFADMAGDISTLYTAQRGYTGLTHIPVTSVALYRTEGSGQPYTVVARKQLNAKTAF